MKIRYKITLLIIVLSLFIIGCSKSQESVVDTFLETEKDYIVGIKISDFETSAKINIFKNGDVRILYTDVNSPLFGMEERYNKNSITTQYDDVQWKFTEILPQTSVIYEAIALINSKKPIKITKETLNGNVGMMYHYQSDNMTFSVFMIHKDNSIKRMEGKKENTAFEINF